MRQTIFRSFRWNSPPPRIEVNVFPAHGLDLSTTLCSQETKFEQC